jgi:telomerase Cajal body protein 1
MDIIEDGMDVIVESSWSPPQFNTSERPSLANRLELEPDPNFAENFIRTAKWYVKRGTGY